MMMMMMMTLMHIQSFEILGHVDGYLVTNIVEQLAVSTSPSEFFLECL
jgi:hypothetical protein